MAGTIMVVVNSPPPPDNSSERNRTDSYEYDDGEDYESSTLTLLSYDASANDVLAEDP